FAKISLRSTGGPITLTIEYSHHRNPLVLHLNPNTLMQPRRGFYFLAAVMFLASPGGLRADDWPMWRYDANRSGASPQELPAKLYLQWARGYMPLSPAWPDQDKMQFDIVREPVVLGQTMYINSSRYDAV